MRHNANKVSLLIAHSSNSKQAATNSASHIEADLDRSFEGSHHGRFFVSGEMRMPIRFLLGD